MNKILLTVLFSLILSACTPGSLFPGAPHATASATPASVSAASITGSASTGVIPVSTTQVGPHPKLIATLSTPHIDQGPDGAVTVPPSRPQDCGYQWAQQDLPDLSSQFLQSIRVLQPEAQATAYAFGENCIHSDGTSVFLPMETDFNVTIPASDTADTALGEWIVKVMQVIDSISPDQIVGPRPGRVIITFESNGQGQGVRFYIDQYHALAGGLSPEEIYQAVKSLP
jgi:hypothetical protein